MALVPSELTTAPKTAIAKAKPFLFTLGGVFTGMTVDAYAKTLPQIGTQFFTTGTPGQAGYFTFGANDIAVAGAGIAASMLGKKVGGGILGELVQDIGVGILIGLGVNKIAGLAGIPPLFNNPIPAIGTGTTTFARSRPLYDRQFYPSQAFGISSAINVA